MEYEVDYIFQYVLIEKSRCTYSTVVLKGLDIKHC